MLDSLARFFGHAVSPDLGQPLIIENRAGAAGRVGASAVGQSAPDGQTILFTTIGTMTILPLIPPKLSYDPERDFKPIAALTQQPLFVAVRPSLNVTSFAQLVDMAKEKPGKLTFGSPGPGSEPHLATERLLRTVGIDMLHVPFRGGGPEMIEFMAGRVDVVVLPEITLRTAIESNKATILATLDTRRAEKFPDAPSIKELGYPSAAYTMTTALFVPAKTPDAIVDRWRRLLPILQRDPGFLKALQDTGANLAIAEGDAFTKVMASDQEEWSRLIRSLNLEAK
ncbi:tripartite tricarboxylate transporter substrate binding protein [Microbacteriaceae bacterium K1510]|nr:tripartite tricarboxylate transporter substrate binding protein [Microbacteriaceae bacterium K1510]